MDFRRSILGIRRHALPGNALNNAACHVASYHFRPLYAPPAVVTFAAMDTENATAAGEQPAVTPDTTPAGAQPANASADTAASSLENLSSEQLLAALEAAEYGEESTEITDEPEPEETETPPAAEETPAAGAEEETAPAGESANTTENKSLRRLPLGGIEEAQRNEFAEAAKLIRKGEAKDLAEAVAILRGTPLETAPATESADTPPVSQTPSTVADIQQQIQALREQRDQADDDFDKPTVRKLTNEIEDLQLSLLRAESADRESRVIQGSWDAKHDAACDQVEAKFKDFAKSEPRFYQLLEDRRVAMEARKDPELKDPAFIIGEAEKIAELLGYNKPVTPAPKVKATVPNGQDLAPAHQTAGRISRPEAQRMIQEVPIEELRKLVCTE